METQFAWTSIHPSAIWFLSLKLLDERVRVDDLIRSSLYFAF